MTAWWGYRGLRAALAAPARDAGVGGSAGGLPERARARSPGRRRGAHPAHAAADHAEDAAQRRRRLAATAVAHGPASSLRQPGSPLLHSATGDPHRRSEVSRLGKTASVGVATEPVTTRVRASESGNISGDLFPEPGSATAAPPAPEQLRTTAPPTPAPETETETDPASAPETRSSTPAGAGSSEPAPRKPIKLRDVARAFATVPVEPQGGPTAAA